jgi:hypothetical protein
VLLLLKQQGLKEAHAAQAPVRNPPLGLLLVLLLVKM